MLPRWCCWLRSARRVDTLDGGADLTQPDTIAQFGLPPYRIDILTSVSGVSFEEAWKERIEGVLEGVQVPCIGRDAFIRNKRASGRKKDLGDLESLGEE